MEFRSADDSGLVYRVVLTPPIRSLPPLEFDLNEFCQGTSASKRYAHDIFYFNNLFLQSLGRKRAKQIYECYAYLHERLINQLSIPDLHKEITSGIEQLFETIEFYELKSFLDQHDIQYNRDKIKDEYSKTPISMRYSQTKSFERQTYTRSSYLELIAMSVYLRFLAPVWGQYLRRISQEHHHRPYREFIALRMISNTRIYESEPMEKLSHFIEESLKSNRRTNIPEGLQYIPYIRQGLSSEDIPTWLLAQAIMKRLLFEPLSDPEQNLVMKIHTLLNNFSRQQSPKSLPNIQSKSKNQPFAGDDDDEGEKSHIEAYKVKESIPAGDFIAYSIFAEDPHRLIMRLSAGDLNQQNYDPNLLAAFVDQSQRGQRLNFDKAQLTMIKWVAGTIIPPSIIENLKKRSLLNVIAACQTLLFQWGYHDFAAMLLAQPTREPIADQLVNRQIKKEYFDSFTRYYPSYPREGAAKAGQQRRQNMAWIGVEQMATYLSKWEWVTFNDESLLTNCQYLHKQQSHNVIAFGGDFKVQLSQLALDLHNQQRLAKEQRQRMIHAMISQNQI